MNLTYTILYAILVFGINKNPAICLEKSIMSYKIFTPLEKTNYFFNSTNIITDDTNHIIFRGLPKYQGKCISKVEEDCICIKENGNFYIHFIVNPAPKCNKIIVLKVDETPICKTIKDDKDTLSLHKIIEIINAPVFLKFEIEDGAVYSEADLSAFISIIKLS